MTLMPAQLSVTVTADGASRALLVVPPAPTTISLPTSFTVELDRSITGPVTIAIDALDDGGYVAGVGRHHADAHQHRRGQTIIAVTHRHRGRQP